MPARFRQHMDVLSKTPAPPHALFGHGCPKSAPPGCPFSLVTFSLGTQRESDSAAAEADETLRPSRYERVKPRSKWIPAFAGMTSAGRRRGGRNLAKISPKAREARSRWIPAFAGMTIGGRRRGGRNPAGNSLRASKASMTAGTRGTSEEFRRKKKQLGKNPTTLSPTET